jgi:hypothetical protein
METTKTKLMIPDRAIASVVFAVLSLLAFWIYCQLLWGTHDHSRDGMAVMGSILVGLETTRRTLAMAALLWCVWSWRKEWWLPSIIATLFTGAALYSAFRIDS